MNNVQEHQENQYYLLWPIGTLIILAIGVFFTSKESFQVISDIPFEDSNLAIVLLFLFFLNFLLGLRYFLSKKG